MDHEQADKMIELLTTIDKSVYFSFLIISLIAGIVTFGRCKQWKPK